MPRHHKQRSTDLATLRIFLRQNLRYRWLFLGAGSSWLLGMVLQKLILALIGARALDRLIDISGTMEANYWPVFLPYLALFVVVGIFGSLFIDTGLLLLSKMETRVKAALQIDLFDRLTAHSLRFHADTFSGALVTQFNRFTKAYVALTDVFMIPGLKLVATVLIATTIIAFFAPFIALAMLIWTVCFTVLNITLTRRRIYLSKRAAAADSTLTAHLADAMGNVSAVKSFAGEAVEYKTHNHLSLDWAAKKYASWVRAIRNDFFLALMMTLLQLITLVMSVVGVMEGWITIGILLLIQIYVTQIISELWGLSNLSRNIEQNLSDAAEMTEILDIPLEVTDPEEPADLTVNSGAVNFDHVDFTHADNDDALFTDFSLDVQPGEKMGVVGHSGSGKTTLTKLMLRFADVDGGSIHIDGQDIRSVRQSDLRSKIAYVPQEPVLFHRSLHDNIAYGRPDASREEVRQAARQAKAAEFIEALPKGYDTMVGERGVKLSGGQRQRIAIARALIKDAPILVLDEATSALDSESEKLIQAALWELMKGRTAIVIAHRLSTIQRMDRIVVLDDGTIVEQGSHKQLLAKKGTYAKLWSHQSGGFLEE